jgi:hypothetical protein
MMGTAKVNKHVPPMTAQDFFYIADVLASIKADRPAKKVVIEAFADALEPTNPNFKRDYFVAACNREQETT